MFHFPIFSSWRSELFQNCIHGFPSKTWEFHFQITWRAESSFNPSFSKWVYLCVCSCDMTSVSYPHVVKPLDTLCPPHLTRRQVMLLLGHRRGVGTWAGESGNPAGCSLLHNPPKLSEPEFPYLKMGNSKPAYLLVSSRGSDEITHVKNTPITTQIAVPITILKIVPVRCFVLLSLTGMKKKNTKISFSGPKMVKWYYFGCSF